MKRRLNEWSRDYPNYRHNEGVEDLLNFVAETMDDEVPSGGLIGEMYSYSGDGQPRMEEDGRNNTRIEMSLFAPFDLPYTTGYEFSDKSIQKAYDREIDEIIEELESQGISYDSEEFMEEFMYAYSEEVVDMDLICHIQEYDLGGVEASFELRVWGSVVDTYTEFFDLDEILSKKYEKRLTSIIKDFYDEV